MKKVRISNLKPGDQFDQALFLPSGQKLLMPGVTLTAKHLQLLSRQSAHELLLADSLEEFARAGMMSRVDGVKLRVGQVADRNVYGPGGVLLIERGQEVEAHHLSALQHARGAFVGAGAEESESASPANQRRERMLMADMAVEQLEQLLPELSLRMIPEEMEIWDRHDRRVERWSDEEQLEVKRAKLVDRITAIYSKLEAGIQVEVSALNDIVEQLLSDLLNHRNQFTQLALLCTRKQDYLPDHAYTVAVLAMASAGQLTWSLDAVRLTGLAALTFDLGMLLVPQRVRVGGCELSDIDRNLVQKHSAFSLVLMQSIRGLDPTVQLAAFQHHERENGSGYPKATRTERIADLSRVIAVADVFAAMTSPRSYHRARLPYTAMEQLIRASANGQFHKPSTRALVQAAGLFPVGSYVKLSDGKTARVIGANPNHLDRPIIRILDDEHELTGPPIDLFRAPPDAYTIVRAVGGPERTPVPV